MLRQKGLLRLAKRERGERALRGDRPRGALGRDGGGDGVVVLQLVTDLGGMNN